MFWPVSCILPKISNPDEKIIWFFYGIDKLNKERTIVLLHILIQEVLNPDSLIIDSDKFDISPTNVYGWLVWGLVFFIGYLKLESTVKSWTIRQKDKYIKELVNKLIEAEKSSITAEEATIYKEIESKHNKLITQNSQVQPTE